MKTRIIFIAVLAFSLVSCSKNLLNLKPIDTATVGNFYQTQSQIKEAVNGVYAGMNSWPVNIYLLMSEVRSNNLYGVTHDAHRDWWDVTTFTVSPDGTDLVHTVWQNLYQMINRANTVLENIDNVQFTDPSLKARYTAETRFLRAYAYFQLVRIYGNVPLVKKTITPAEGIKIGQSKPADVYNFIISEMKAAIKVLPPSYDGADQGRVTKWAAEGILAKVYLTMAGYPLKDNSHENDAKALLKDIMNQEGTYVHFAQNYADMFKLANENKYFLFEVEFTPGGNGNGTNYPVYIIPSDISQDSIPYGGFTSATRLAISPDLMNSYDSTDVRFNATIDTSYVQVGDSTVGHTPFYHKFIDPNAASSVVSHYDWPDNFPLLRYADVLMMYAQILNDQNGAPPAEAVSILNRIRERAGLSDIHPATKADFQSALNLEERHEFADEGQWWWYLVRTGQAVNTINTWSAATGGQGGQAVNINDNKLIYAIPQSEIDIYPGLYTQNPGY